MTRRYCFILLPLLFCFAAALPAGGGKEKDTAVQITGKVRLVGSSPLTELVITGSEKEWYVDKEEEHKLKDLQHKTVTVKGKETVKALKFANGMSAGERRTIKNIKIITVE